MQAAVTPHSTPKPHTSHFACMPSSPAPQATCSTWALPRRRPPLRTAAQAARPLQLGAPQRRQLLMRSHSPQGLPVQATREKLVPRPWAVDHLDGVVDRLINQGQVRGMVS